ncbi:MAG: energy-coupling factor transporter transmembrane protein EcfT [Hamadaea sp.]|uniref:energy-coupling factor transporter transmembrane component T family protein n=1 Tax=Hamadaea sp. TaxID=2024425 RepID=UPI00179CAC31|nr:energy-coupling factor transporter transmembrane component T [Hamadaea sp.]NUR69405.1 energy-coupling factor transporter transmembrane protein EcfT [Hamadaea sp.]NUT22190.1 energy-coupling factor transporter transmembrane protein EcfT [Hamadaea sp.]
MILARRAPVAKLGAALLLSLAALTTLDSLVLGGIVLLTLLITPLFGLTPWGLLRRAWPALLGAASVVISLSLFAASPSGDVLLDFGPFLVTSSVLSLSVSYALRLLALALPAVLVYATTDPTDLADSLIQHVKAPARFAIGALAAFRLVGLLSEEWRLISMARRARGIDSGGNPLRLFPLFAGTAFGLLVGAIRRGTRLAQAMDARGFDSGTPRTVARPSPFGLGDWALLFAALLLASLVVFSARS